MYCSSLLCFQSSSLDSKDAFPSDYLFSIFITLKLHIMKQILTTMNSTVLSFPCYHSIDQQKVFSKYLFALLAGVAFLISSCQKENPDSNSQKQNSLNSFQKQNLLNSSQKQKAVPFKGKFEAIEEPFNETTDRITGTGEGTQVGKSTFVAFANFVNFPFITGTQTLTAANGDNIYSTINGFIPDPDANGIVWINNDNIITGGTGKFVGATGSFIAHGSSNSTTLTFEGTISY